MTFPRKSLELLIVSILLVSVAACGGLAGEPRIVSTEALPTVTPTAPPDLGRPLARVSLARGAEIFGGAQGCANCHGIGGLGDGPVAANFTCTIPPVAKPDIARSQTINAWFAITTSGNKGATTCLMPPWNSRLDEQQRWDVTSYLYSLHYTADLLAQGQKIWQDKCMACHGERGAGDGPQAKGSARPVPNFSNPAYFITLSDTDLWKTVTNGLGPVMPSFKDQLTDDERWSVVAYARSLNWDGVSAIGNGSAESNASAASTAAATSAATQAAATIPDSPTIAVSGKITNGTPDAPAIAAGQTLTLRVIDLASGAPKDVQTLTTKTTNDGVFSFGDVPRQLNMIYVATTDYGGLAQISTPIRLITGAGATLDLSFRVYEVTTDPGVIQVENMHLFAAPFSANSLLLRQGMSFHNTSNRLFFDAGHSIAVTVPAGAQQVTLDPTVANQFIIDNGAVIRGLQPIYPGAENAAALQFSYLLPYDNNAQLTAPTLYPITSLDVHMPQVSGLTLADAPFVPGDALTLQDGIYNTFTLQGAIPAGGTLHFSLKSPQEQSTDRRNVLAIVLFAAGILLTLTGVAAWRLNRQNAPTPAISPSDKIVQAIADLDTRFEKGQIEREAYEIERARLKAEAAALLEIQ
ncbi:MAG: c-type cytochrome [Chloroflexota bacterium]